MNESDIQELRLTIESHLQAEYSITIPYIKPVEVTDAIKQLNSNNFDGNKGLYLLLSCTHVRVHLAKLFTCMLRHGHNPDYIFVAMISIPKNCKGDINFSDNHWGMPPNMCGLNYNRQNFTVTRDSGFNAETAQNRVHA